MATNKQLKFFKGANAPAAPAAGMIWFCTTDRTIRVYTGTEWEKYSGLVNAEWVAADKKLNITSANGTVTTLDLSDCASASDISTKLTTINNTLSSHDTRITTAQGAAEDAQAAAEAADAKAVKEAEDRASEITRVEGLISAEATRADAAEKANAAAAKAADDKAAAAQTYAEGVNTALGQEVTRATNKENELAGKITTLEQAIGTVDTKIAEAIEKLDTPEAGVTGDGTFVDVTVKQVNGVVTSVSVAESDIASAQALNSEISRATAAEESLDGRLDALDAATTGRVSVLESKVDALSSATHFLGVKAVLPDSASNGDIVIVGNKEYVWDDNEDGTNILGTAGWIELGDTTAESGRITTLESWKTEAAQAIADNTTAIENNDVDIKALQDANDAQAELNATLATKQELTTEKNTLNALITDNSTAITALQGADTAINGRLDGHDTKIGDLETAVEGKVAQGDFNTLAGKVSTAESDIDGVQEDVANLQAGTGLADGTSAPVYTNSNYLGSAATMVAADMALDAKIKEVADSVTNKNVSAEGDTYISATATNNKVTVTAVTGTVESKSGLATNQGVYDALCWVEFE